MTQPQQQQQQQIADSSAEGESATAAASAAAPRRSATGEPASSSASSSSIPPEQASAEAAPAPAANDSRNNDNNNSSNNDNRNSAALFREIQYAVNSFYAIVKPVLLTMILAALAVVYIRTDESAAAGEEALTNSYTVLGGDDEDDGDSTSSTARVVGESVVNAFVIVVVICALTFLIVLLYKYKFMKCLIGYMIVSSGMLLGFLASQMFAVAIDRYQWPIDKVTFGVLMYNFAVTGCVAIFAPCGAVPPAAAQGYLIATSVIVAWQLSHFSEILAWVLLVLLACYDLFAVLSPCGPLKALVRLMQRDDAPNMPGLLYEVSLPLAPRRARPENNATGNSTSTASASGDSEHNNDVQLEPRSPSSAAHASITTTTTTGDDDHPSPVLMTPSSNPTTNIVSRSATLFSGSIQDQDTSNDPNYGETAPDPPETNTNLTNTQEDPGTRTTTIQAEDTTGRTVDDSNVELVTGRIPVALARLYKLRFLHDPQPYWITAPAAAAAAAANPEENPAADSAAVVDNNNNQNDSSQTYNYSPVELTALVDVLFSARGGRIVPTLTLPDAPDLYRQHSGSEETRYTVVDQHGQQRRVLFVNREGRIFEDLRVQNAREEIKERTSIKLGLGDFIFYSILVSKAALYSFTAFCACALAVVAGMGLTLCLLAVYGKALPALPISIALGVVFYLTTRYVAEPWVHTVFIEQVYV